MFGTLGRVWLTDTLAYKRLPGCARRLRMTFPSPCASACATARPHVVEGSEPGFCGRPLAEQSAVVEERLAVAGLSADSIA